jgi:hypothetical protein
MFWCLSRTGAAWFNVFDRIRMQCHACQTNFIMPGKELGTCRPRWVSAVGRHPRENVAGQAGVELISCSRDLFASVADHLGEDGQQRLRTM